MINIVLLFLGLLFCSLSHSKDHQKGIRIAIVSLYDKSYKHIGQYAHANKQEYAKKHNYDAFLYTESLDSKRRTHWSKIKALQKHLKDYDWLFWTDADALIMNKEIRLETFIDPNLDENIDIIITKDCYGCINTGNFLIKNSAWSAQFLNQMYDPKYLHHPKLNDNWAFLELYNNDLSVPVHVKLISPNLINSYIQCAKKQKEGLYKEGDFIVHFAGLHTNKEKLMKIWYQKSLTQSTTNKNI